MEKRKSTRCKSALPVRISPEVSGETIDLNAVFVSDNLRAENRKIPRSKNKFFFERRKIIRRKDNCKIDFSERRVCERRKVLNRRIKDRREKDFPINFSERRKFERRKMVWEDYSSDFIGKRREWLGRQTNTKLIHLGRFSFNPQDTKRNIENLIGAAQVPIGIAGPLKVNGEYAKGEFYVPMATTEGAMVLTYHMGMRLVGLSGGVTTVIENNKIHIDPFFLINDASEKKKILNLINSECSKITQHAEETSRHLKLINIEPVFLKPYLVLKFIYNTQDAQGLNMINNATREACKFISKKTGISFYLRSHYSAIKHFSKLNMEKGFGRKVKAQAVLPKRILAKLKVTPIEMKNFFDACIFIGHSSGIPAVNVQAANAIAAIFIATGQDVADLSSSHVCETRCDVINKNKEESFFIETTLFNLIVGSVGGGTGLGTNKECLEIMDCYGTGKVDKFSEIIAATVLSGEFVTAAAVINDTYVQAHNKYGRNRPVI